MSKYGCIYLGDQIVSRPAEGTINITNNGVVNVTDYDEAIVNVPSREPGDVNFYDYDGTLLYSYSKSQFAALSALPDNPSHDGLTAQGWNWSLANAQTTVAACGGLDIGQNYVTSDSKTKIYITVEEPGLVFRLDWVQTGAGTTVNWGDGSATETNSYSSSNVDVYLTHTYNTAGDYVITMTPTGTYTAFYLMLGVYASTQGAMDATYWQYIAAVRKIEYGSGVTCIGSFGRCANLETITIPTSITSLYSTSLTTSSEWTGFSLCAKLKCVVFGSSISFTTVGDIQQMFDSCTSLKHVLFPKITTGSITGSYAFQTTNIERMYFPCRVVSISYGFTNALSLKRLVLGENCVTFNGSGFLGDTSMSNGIIPTIKEIYSGNTTPPSIAANAFGNASNTLNFKIYVPSSAVNTYKGATNWSAYSSYITAMP